MIRKRVFPFGSTRFFICTVEFIRLGVAFNDGKCATPNRINSTVHSKLKNMRIKFIIILLALIQLNCNLQEKNIEQTWLLVSQKDKSDNNVTTFYNGTLIDLKSNQFSKTYPILKREDVSTYSIENQIIKLDTSDFGKIIHLSTNSLIVEDAKDVMRFIPLKETSFEESDAINIYNELVTNTWLAKANEQEMRFYCDTAKWGLRYEELDWIKCLFYSDRYSNSYLGEVSDYEWWTIKYFKGKILFIYSVGQMERSYIQLTEINHHHLKGQELSYFESDWKKIELIKSEIPANLNELTKRTLQGNWSSTILNKSKNGKTEHPLSKEEGIEEVVIDTTTKEPDTSERYLIMDYASEIFEWRLRQQGRITLSDLEADNLSFVFYENGKYVWKAGQIIIRKGEQWAFTTDKKYIYLDNPYSSNNFIKIVSFDGNTLEIEKDEYIDVEQENLYDCFITKLKLKLTKE